MAKRSKRPEDEPRKGRPSSGGRKPKYILYVRIDEAIGAALDRYVEGTEPKPSHTSTVETALRRFLGAEGYWPPPEPSAE